MAFERLMAMGLRWASSSLSLLDVCVHFFHQIWEFSAIISSHAVSALSLPALRDPAVLPLVLLAVSHGPLACWLSPVMPSARLSSSGHSFRPLGSARESLWGLFQFCCCPFGVLLCSPVSLLIVVFCSRIVFPSARGPLVL